MTRERAVQFGIAVLLVFAGFLAFLVASAQGTAGTLALGAAVAAVAFCGAIVLASDRESK